MLFRFSNLHESSPRPSSAKAGFTLLEMMVVIAIMTIMTGILLNNLPNFRDKTTLQLVAQDVAVTIRGAQVFGIGTRVVAGGAFPSHGIFFCNTDELSGAPSCRKNFLLFSDEDSNKVFTGGGDFDSQLASTIDWNIACQNDRDGVSGSGECREVYSLGGNIEICYIELADAVSGDGTGANIVFSRLYPDAFILDTGDNTNHTNVKIYLKSTKAPQRRVVTVYNTGSITVSAVPDDNETICQEN